MKFLILVFLGLSQKTEASFPPAPCRNSVLTAHWPRTFIGLPLQSSPSAALARKLYLLYADHPFERSEHMAILIPILADAAKKEGTAFLSEIEGHIAALDQALKSPNLEEQSSITFNEERKYFKQLAAATRSPFRLGVSESDKAVAISRSLNLLIKQITPAEMNNQKYFDNADKKYPSEWEPLIKAIRANSDFVNHYLRLLQLNRIQKISATPLESAAWATLIYHSNRRTPATTFSLAEAQKEVWSFVDSSSGMDVPKAGYSNAAKAFAQKYATNAVFIEWLETKKKDYYAQAAQYLSTGNFGAYTNASFMGGYFGEMANMATGYAPNDP